MGCRHCESANLASLVRRAKQSRIKTAHVIASPSLMLRVNSGEAMAAQRYFGK